MNRFDRFLSKANMVVFTAIQLGFYAMAVYVGVIILKTIASFIW
jgi:hypothetical protein